MHVDFVCDCGRRFMIGGIPGKYYCRTCSREIVFGDYVEPTLDPHAVDRVRRSDRIKDRTAKRARIQEALLKRARPGEQLGDLVARYLESADRSPRLIAYLSNWLQECGCDRSIAIQALNSPVFKKSEHQKEATH